MKVAVIGCSGGMGRFFTEYLLSRGHEVTGSDVRDAHISEAGFTRATSNLDAVKGTQVVLVATPIDCTVRTVKEIAPELRSGVRVVEIASLKGKITRQVEPIVTKMGAKLVSLHPLFGPTLSPRANMKVCVVGGGRESVRFARTLLPDATLIPIEEEEHDRAMGVILSLTHLLNIAYAATVAEHLTPEEFRKLESPTSAVQLSLAEGVLMQDPALYSYIQLENSISSRLAEELIEHLAELSRIIARKDRKAYEKVFSRLADVFSDDSKTGLEGVYEAFEAKQRR